jgi:SWI/SNF-related matrix-associated actin-dependent regulator 1 of chromatin subfamily A
MEPLHAFTKTRHGVTFVPNKAQAEELQQMQVTWERMSEETEKSTTKVQKTRAKNKQDVHMGVMRRKSAEFKGKLCSKHIAELMTTYADTKLVFFTKHLFMVKVIETCIQQHNVPYIVVTGKTPPKQRDKLLASIRSQQDPNRVAILTMDSCGKGVTLCPGASVVVICELDYTPANMEQAEDRVNRLGAIRNANVYWWALEGSIDETMMRMLERKHRLNGKVVDAVDNQQFVFHAQLLYT